MFLVDVLKEQQRVKITMATSKDDNYSREFLNTKIDTCRIAKGVMTSMFTRALMESFAESSSFNYTCPFLKNIPIEVKNHIITDKFFPPMPFEQRLKIDFSIYGFLKERKGWTYIYNATIYLRFKKW